MNDKLDIFILTCKDFDCKVNNPIYKIISNSGLDGDYSLECYRSDSDYNISKYNPYICELTMMFWIYKNYPIKDYIGFCHHRRYWDFYDDVIDIEKELSENDVILPYKFKLFDTVYGQYKSCHNLHDLKDIVDVIHKLYPEYDQSCYDVITGNELYTYNMFIMKREDFIKYCDFMFNVIFEYMSEKDFYDTDNIEKYVNDNGDIYFNTIYPSNNVLSYQKRFIGFLTERLTTIFIHHNFSKIKHCKVNIIE